MQIRTTWYHSKRRYTYFDLNENEIFMVTGSLQSETTEISQSVSEICLLVSPSELVTGVAIKITFSFQEK